MKQNRSMCTREVSELNANNVKGIVSIYTDHDTRRLDPPYAITAFILKYRNDTES